MAPELEINQQVSKAEPPRTTPRRRAGVAPRGDVTPMVKQYLDIKQEHPHDLLLFRMGDFYEMFFDDAVAASTALDIALTKRGRHRGEDIPMCGIPVHSADGYIERLIRGGFKVAVCEQVEDPAEARKRGPKTIVAREVLRVITPGTLTEDTLLDARSHNYLVALGRAGNVLGLACFDMSTGDLFATDATVATLATELARQQPGELLVSESLLTEPSLFELFGEWKTALTPLAPSRFSSANGERRLKEIYQVASLDGFGVFSRAHLAALDAVIDYVELTQRGHFPKLRPPVLVATDATLAIDSATRRNLEISQNLSGERRGSLLHTIDRTLTSAGARMLATRLAAPLTDVAAINARLDLVQLFAERDELRAGVRAALRHCPDLERSLSRLSLGRGGPRDLAAVRDAATRAQKLRAALTEVPKPQAEAALTDIVGKLGQHDVLIDRLTRALAGELPLLARDGGFIAPGYLPELDEQRTLRDASRKLIAGLQRKYAELTGIASLKVRHNNVFGYFVEITQTQAAKVGTDHPTFIHRQTLASAVRYTTLELSDLADRIDRAADHALRLELVLFDELGGEVMARIDDLAQAAAQMAALDVASALAELALERGYVRPKVDASGAFHIEGGRHPVVEGARAAAGDTAFIANDCDLAEQRRLWLITGPNMAGKSTFLRQNALIAILAQMGAYVPRAFGPYRRCRPPVQPRRRRRRSRPRPLDLHGRDDRNCGDPQPGDRAVARDPRRNRPWHRDLRRPIDRLGDNRTSPRSESLPRPVRDSLPRIDGAGGEARVVGMPYHADQGVAGRRRVPARNRTRLGRSIIRHPGGQAGRAATGGGGPGWRGAVLVGSRRAGRRLGAIGRRPAAVCRGRSDAATPGSLGRRHGPR